MAKSQTVAEQVVTAAAVVTLPFFHAGFAQPSASDAKGYADDKSGRTTRTLANVVLTLGSKDRPSTVSLVGAAVKAMQDPGKAATISVTFPTMKRGTAQIIQTEDTNTKEALATFRAEILAAFKPWWTANRGGVAAASKSVAGAVTAADLGIEL